jgi:hypothetical protein
MLISRRKDRLHLIEQVEHAQLAGELAAHWGNEQFTAPEPRDSVHLAAAVHDDGWREADEQPLFNAEARRPLHFLEIGMRDHVPLYRRGVERIVEMDPYAGLLVSMHWTGLYRSRWGMQSGKVEFADDALQDEVVAAEEQRWIALKRELTRHVRRGDLEHGLWHNYELLQAWDLLSLYVCLANHDPAPDGTARPLTETLKSIDQEPGVRTIEGVPVRPAGERVDLALRALERGVVAVDPYPFATDVDCRVSARVIPDDAYDSFETVASAVSSADDLIVQCRLTRLPG